jgi:hypothetical protein
MFRLDSTAAEAFNIWDVGKSDEWGDPFCRLISDIIEEIVLEDRRTMVLKVSNSI